MRLWRKYLQNFQDMWIRDPVTATLFAKSCIGYYWPLIWRIPILIWIIATIFWSMMDFWGPLEMWFLYMTHWGLVIILIQSFLGVIIAINGCRGKLIEAGMQPMNKMTADIDIKAYDTAYKLPRYVKVYWMFYNMAIPIAFLVTFFYWVLLKKKAASKSAKHLMYSPNPTLDYFIHALNSVVMSFELLAARHPSRLKHVWQPLLVAIVYMMMGITYYAAGGKDPAGNPWIYPMIDWSKPESALLVVFLCAVYLCIIHVLVVIVAAIRDKIVSLLCKDTSLLPYDTDQCHA